MIHARALKGRKIIKCGKEWNHPRFAPQTKCLLRTEDMRVTDSKHKCQIVLKSSPFWPKKRAHLALSSAPEKLERRQKNSAFPHAVTDIAEQAWK
jgi:hypothetical protein